MRVLLTGAAGFIGFHVAQRLLDRGDTVVGVDNLNRHYNGGLKNSRLAVLRRHKHAKRFTLVKADVSDAKAMAKIFAKFKPDRVCHLAAQAGVRYSLEDPYLYETSNNLGTLVMLEQCRHYGVKYFIYASSSSVYGNNEKMPFSEEDRVDSQVSMYAATKKYNESLAHVYHGLYGIRCTGLRFFTVYGPYGRPDLAFFTFVGNGLRGKPITIFNKGKHRRDFTYVGDIAQGVLQAIDKGYALEVFNLAAGESVELLTFVNIIEEALGITMQKKFAGKQKGDVEATMADISHAKKLLGYKPTTSVREGMAEFIAWYRKYYKV